MCYILSNFNFFLKLTGSWERGHSWVTKDRGQELGLRLHPQSTFQFQNEPEIQDGVDSYLQSNWWLRRSLNAASGFYQHPTIRCEAWSSTFTVTALFPHDNRNTFSKNALRFPISCMKKKTKNNLQSWENSCSCHNWFPSPPFFESSRNCRDLISRQQAKNWSQQLITSGTRGELGY